MIDLNLIDKQFILNTKSNKLMSFFDNKDPLSDSQPKSVHHPEPPHDKANLFFDKLTQGCEKIKNKLGLDDEK
jgi:hypothetical protein